MNSWEKKIRQKSPEEEEDRFSDLPNGLRCHILSFLLTKEAVRTSVLSTAWKDLFLGLGNVRVDDTMPRRMVRFISRRFSSVEASPVTDFKLECHHFPKSSVMISWFNALILRRAKVIQIEELCEHDRERVFQPRISVPSEIFVSDALEVLKIRGGRFDVQFPEFIRCQNLKVLHLNCFTASNETGVVNLNFGDESYPVLEEFDFGSWNTYKECVVLSISLATLKRLVFRSIASTKGTKIDIFTPHLEHLEFMERLMLVSKNRLWFHVVELNFRNCRYLISAVIGWFKESQRRIGLLNSISKVRELVFDASHSLELLGTYLHFPELMHMVLTDCRGDLARHFLQSAPNLETFVYDAGRIMSFLDSGDGVPPCFSKSLREVRLKYIKKDVGVEDVDFVFTIVNFFLQHGAILEKVIVEHPFTTVPFDSTLNKLRNMNRLSKKCVIEIHDDEEM